MTTSEENGDMRELTLQAGALAATVERLNEDYGNQVVQLSIIARANRRVIVALVVTAVVIVSLLATVSVGMILINNNSTAIGRVTDRLDNAQTVQRQKALCPLYSLFLASKSDQARAAYPRGTTEYDNAFKVIEDGYAALDCLSFK